MKACGKRSTFSKKRGQSELENSLLRGKILLKSVLLMVRHGHDLFLLFHSALLQEKGSRGLSREFIRTNITFGVMHSELTVKGVSC